MTEVDHLVLDDSSPVVFIRGLQLRPVSQQSLAVLGSTPWRDSTNGEPCLPESKSRDAIELLRRTQVFPIGRCLGFPEPSSLNNFEIGSEEVDRVFGIHNTEHNQRQVRSQALRTSAFAPLRKRQSDVCNPGIVSARRCIGIVGKAKNFVSPHQQARLFPEKSTATGIDTRPIPTPALLHEPTPAGSDSEDAVRGCPDLGVPSSWCVVPIVVTEVGRIETIRK